MDIREFLSRLRSWSGPSESGEYKCQCPAHDDRRASLSVNVGDKGIIFKCHAGCSKEAVLDAMGLTVSDLMTDRARGAAGSGTRPHPAASQPPSPTGEGKKAAGSNAAEPREIDKVYSYVDEKGQEVFQVVRYVPKDFRQRVRDDSARGGYRWSIKGVRPVVYRLPEIMRAVTAGERVFVVEGEKDADTMAAMGYAATTSPMGAGKWRPEHSEQLRGAHVCILPDNDNPGYDHAVKVSESLDGIAADVRILDLTQVWPEMPLKGDVSDFFRAVGQGTGQLLLKQLIERTPEIPKHEKTDFERAAEKFETITGYCVRDGCICQMNDGTAKRLCTFVCEPRKIVSKDDGLTVEKMFEIAGWTKSGRALSTVRVRAKDFPSLSWVLEHWDFSANIMPGSTVKDKLRYAITEAGEMTAERETVYTHTGWRKSADGWQYLHQGGCIGGEDERVELDDALSGYTMGADDGEDLSEYALSETAFRDGMAPHVSVPLLGLCYLSPLREFLLRGHAAPHFILFLRGGSGTHKSTATVMALSHFGEFDIDTMPATFHDTANAIRRKAFTLKDSLLAIDDYHPESSPQERRRMEATAQALARAFGDGADRGRMNADRTLQENQRPRCLAMMTGEDLPNIGESGVARLYTVDVGPHDIEITDGLEVAQRMAREGYYRRAMRGYIQWLAKQADELPKTLPDMYYKLRQQARKDGKGLHGRAPEAIAHIMLGYEMMLNYISDVGGMTVEEARKEFLDAWHIILENAKEQGAEARDSRPTKQFLTTIGELITSRAVAIRDLTDPKSPEPGINGIGYMDHSYYYLLPDQAYARVSKLYRDQGQEFVLSKRGLYKQLRDDGLIELDADGRATRGKNIDGKTLRLLWVPRSRIDYSGGTPKAEQTQMAGVDDDDWTKGL